jgi:hypothetical protein
MWAGNKRISGGPIHFFLSSRYRAEKDGQIREDSCPPPRLTIYIQSNGGLLVANPVVQVPVSLLLDSDQCATTKVVWMAKRLGGASDLKRLTAQTGLSAPTVRRCLGHPLPTPSGPRVKIPSALLAEQSVGAQAKVLYGILQTTPGFRGHGGAFTYSSLSAFTHLSRNTLRRALTELTGAGWLQVAQANQHSPIHFTLGRPEWRRSLDQAELARRRLKRAKHSGEALMQEYLTLLIDSDQFTDNARPGFLINPLTGERLELDRFYPPGLAFEFHGAQHDRTTERFTQAEVDAQRLRDLIKAGLCLYSGIQLVIVRAEDLSLQGMIKKVGQAMPLRDLAGHDPLIEMLDGASLSYQAVTAKFQSN